MTNEIIWKYYINICSKSNQYQKQNILKTINRTIPQYAKICEISMPFLEILGNFLVRGVHLYIQGYKVCTETPMKQIKTNCSQTSLIQTTSLLGNNCKFYFKWINNGSALAGLEIWWKQYFLYCIVSIVNRRR